MVAFMIALVVSFERSCCCAMRTTPFKSAAMREWSYTVKYSLQGIGKNFNFFNWRKFSFGENADNSFFANPLRGMTKIRTWSIIETKLDKAIDVYTFNVTDGLDTFIADGYVVHNAPCPI